MFEMLIGKTSNVIEGPPGVEFLGEVPVTGFINGLQLASAIGLTAGTAQHSNEPWLHFNLDGKTLYVAKKPYRYSVNWDHINARGAVFGTRGVTIGGKTYKVRLLKSAVGDTYAGIAGFDPVGAYDSEWNRLMYSVHSGNHTHPNNPSPMSGEGINFGSLARYTDTDLVLHYSAGNGVYNWCQETSSSNTANRVLRGYFGVSNLYQVRTSYADSYYGWRPVLELVG